MFRADSIDILGRVQVTPLESGRIFSPILLTARRGPVSQDVLQFVDCVKCKTYLWLKSLIWYAVSCNKMTWLWTHVNLPQVNKAHLSSVLAFFYQSSR